MMVATLFRTPASLCADLDRMQREMERSFGLPTSIRAAGGTAFPAINIGSTADAVEVYAFAPGLDASKLDVTVDNNLLTLAGERKLAEPPQGGSVYAEERFDGTFRRAISLPDDVDPLHRRRSARAHRPQGRLAAPPHRRQLNWRTSS
jgi:HSP20 family protein